MNAAGGGGGFGAAEEEDALAAKQEALAQQAAATRAAGKTQHVADFLNQAQQVQAQAQAQAQLERMRKERNEEEPRTTKGAAGLQGAPPGAEAAAAIAGTEPTRSWVPARPGGGEAGSGAGRGFGPEAAAPALAEAAAATRRSRSRRRKRSRSNSRSRSRRSRSRRRRRSRSRNRGRATTKPGGGGFGEGQSGAEGGTQDDSGGDPFKGARQIAVKGEWAKFITQNGGNIYKNILTGAVQDTMPESFFQQNSRRPAEFGGEMVRPVSLVVHAFPQEWEESDMIQVFQPFGKVWGARILRHPDGSKRNIAFLDMEKKLEAEKAIQMLDGYTFEGFKQMHVGFGEHSFSLR